MTKRLLFRSDIHNLFDLGGLAVTVDDKVRVSRRIKEEYENGGHYYAFDDQPLQVLPTMGDARRGREFLASHAHTVFKG